jgi:hypothetical protein
MLSFLAGNETIIPVSATTLADSISVDLPRDGVRAVRAARETGGSYLTVNDTEILAAIASLGKAGIFAEPAGATSYAGMLKAMTLEEIEPDDPILVINTGSGLKDVRAATSGAGRTDHRAEPASRETSDERRLKTRHISPCLAFLPQKREMTRQCWPMQGLAIWYPELLSSVTNHLCPILSFRSSRQFSTKRETCLSSIAGLVT